MARDLPIYLACALVGILPAPGMTADRAATHQDVVALGSRVADWQLAHLDGEYLTHFKDESRSARSWEQGAFWVGLSRFADASRAPRFTRALLDMGRGNRWTPGPRLYHADDHVIGQSYLWAATHGAGAEAIAPLRDSFDQILAKPPRVHLSFVVAACARLMMAGDKTTSAAAAFDDFRNTRRLTGTVFMALSPGVFFLRRD